MLPDISAMAPEASESAPWATSAPRATSWAAWRTWPMISRSSPTIVEMAMPNWSRSLLGATLRLRSPRLMAWATLATSLR
ncbi:hypothetical protein D3C87_2000920 [compost metagenome]